MELSSYARRRMVAILELQTGSMEDGRAIVAEALTDSDFASDALRTIASLVQAAVRDNSEAHDALLGQRVREAVEGYALRCLERRGIYADTAGLPDYSDYPLTRREG